MTINAPFTEQYTAPEVAKRAPRNSASDMWSLGIVFLDMTTVLRGRTLNDMKRFFQEHSSRRKCVWANAEAAHEWFEQLRQAGSGPESDNEPLTWIKDLTQSVPSNRPMAWALINQIRNASSVGNFIGHCCTTDDEAEYYPSPPSSSHWEEVEDFYPTEIPELQERPFGSLIEPSRQTSIEQWLGLDSDLYPKDLSDFSNVSGGNIGETSYEIAEDSTTRYTVRSSSPQASVFKDHTTIEQCEGYDIVEDASDDEKTIDERGQGYETMEDSSGSEVTAKDLSSASNIRLGLMEDNDTILVDAANDTEVFHSKVSQVLREQLNALPEDSFEGHPLTPPSQACLPAPEVEPPTVVSYTMPSSAESHNPTKSMDFDALSTASLDKSSKVKHTAVSRSRNQKSTKSAKFDAVKNADVIPSMAIEDGRVVPTFKEGIPTEIAKPSSSNDSNVDVLTTAKDFILLSSKAQTPTKSAKLGSSKSVHVDPSTTMKVPIRPSAGGQEKTIGSKPGSLNAANLAILSDSVNRDSTTKETKQPKDTSSTQKKTRRDPAMMRPDISPLEYM